MDSFTGGACEHEPPDAGAGEVQGVLGLEAEVEPRETQAGSGGDGGGEEGGDWGVDPGGQDA